MLQIIAYVTVFTSLKWHVITIDYLLEQSLLFRTFIDLVYHWCHESFDKITVLLCLWKQFYSFSNPLLNLSKQYIEKPHVLWRACFNLRGPFWLRFWWFISAYVCRENSFLCIVFLSNIRRKMFALNILGGFAVMHWVWSVVYFHLLPCNIAWIAVDH